MSRSRRHTPICGWTTAASEQQDKHQRSRAARKYARQMLATTLDDTLLPIKQPRVYMSKDGKHRFDPLRWPEGMRK